MKNKQKFTCNICDEKKPEDAFDKYDLENRRFVCKECWNNCVICECYKCGEWFDVNNDMGIFGDKENVDGYVCDECSDEMTAREFVEVINKVA